MGLRPQELREMAETRLGDSETLFDGSRYDGTIYLSGYVIELALKATWTIGEKDDL
jgi:HEPN domain-containing protein